MKSKNKIPAIVNPLDKAADDKRFAPQEADLMIVDDPVTQLPPLELETRRENVKLWYSSIFVNDPK